MKEQEFEGKGAEFTIEKARTLLAAVDTGHGVDLRERAIIAMPANTIRPEGHLGRKNPGQLAREYCKAGGIEPSRSVLFRSPRKSLVAQHGDHRRDPRRGAEARGAGVRRSRRHRDDRVLIRPQGGRRRNGGPAYPGDRRDPSVSKPRRLESTAQS